MTKILVIGLRGSGKSTYCMKNMQDGLVYDMDAIASAFRLKYVHEEYFSPARRMANDMMLAFARNAENYVDRVMIIRTAPTILEVEDIAPDEIVVCTKNYVDREMTSRERAQERINDVISHFTGVIPITKI